MAKIIIAAPCQKVHRFLLPPDARHVMQHSFRAGSVVLAKVLSNLLLSAHERPYFGWELWEPQDNDPPLSSRYIKLRAYDAPPPLKKHLKPETRFLRVHEKEDSDGYDKHVHWRFEFESSRVVTPVVVVGGTDAQSAWRWVNEDDLADQCVVYVLAKSFDAIMQHCDLARKRAGGKDRVIVGQIELADLAKEYPLQMDTSYERTIGSICGANAEEPSDLVPGKAGPWEDRSRKQDCLTELLGNSALDHLIIRIGNGACLIASRPEPGKGPEPMVWLYHHPERCAPTNSPGLGVMLAYDLLLACAMVRQLCGAEKRGEIPGAMAKGAKVAVQATYRCFCEGFGVFHKDSAQKDEGSPGHPARVRADKLFERFVRHGLKIEEENGGELSFLRDLSVGEHAVMFEPAAHKTVPCKVDYAAARSPNRFWRMVVPCGEGATKSKCKERALGHLGVAGRKQQEPLPIVRIGKLELVDRHEVEDYLFLQHLLRDYQADGNRNKPLSIGVFGQPGGGKSFGVKQLVQEMSGGNENFAKDEITINLTQLRSLKELADNFHKVRNTCLKGVVPLVFFDEFDSGFEDHSFGWLKYFLAPMQDGEFLHDGNTYHFGKAIFVFAGGINHTFAEFNGRARDVDFCEAKGPDFISRLRGKLNIKSMNRPDGDDKEIEHVYMIRRAVFLRNKLKERLGKPEKELMDPKVAEAFLTTPRFKHGVRSMEAILDMSSCEYGQTYHACHLPPRGQLEMHVDAREFLRRAGILVSMDNC